MLLVGLVVAMAQAQDQQPDHPKDPLVDPHAMVQEPLNMAPTPPFAPPLLAGPAVGMVFLVAGVLGWIALGIATMVLDSKSQKPVGAPPS
jgi:hypothetical protein